MVLFAIIEVGNPALFKIIKRLNSQLFKIIGRPILALFKIIGSQGGFFAEFQTAFLLEMRRLFCWRRPRSRQPDTKNAAAIGVMVAALLRLVGIVALGLLAYERSVVFSIVQIMAARPFCSTSRLQVTSVSTCSALAARSLASLALASASLSMVCR